MRLKARSDSSTGLKYIHKENENSESKEHRRGYRVIIRLKGKRYRVRTKTLEHAIIVRDTMCIALQIPIPEH